MHRMRMMTRLVFGFFLVPSLILPALVFTFPSTEIVGGQRAAVSLDYRTINSNGFPKIVSEVAVFDENNIPVAGLTEADFSVFEDGVRQLPITVEEFGGDSGGVSVVLVMDVSGSMEDEIDQAKEAAITFVNLLSEFDQAALVSFWGDVKIEQDFTKDKSLLINAINGLELDDGTSVYDAAVLATQMLQPVEGKRAVVLLSDGRDNSSDNSLDDVLALVSTSEIPIYAIGLGLKKNGRQELIDIAETSGGIFYDSPTADELEAIYREIAFLLSQAFYLVTYETSNCTADGTQRAVQIDAQFQGMTGVGAKNYVAPGHFAPFTISAPSQPSPGQVFTLFLQGGGDGAPLFNLHAFSARLKFPSQFLKLQPPIRPGALLGANNDFSLNFTIESGDSSVIVNFQKNIGAGPVTGSGVLAEIDFVVDSSVIDGEPYRFDVEILSSQDGGGCEVALQTAPFSTTGDGMLVWPGDTNANGLVELTDVLVLGVYWEMNGPARPGPEDQLLWAPHLAKRFQILDATHADGDGGGLIDERDIIPIGLNWGKNQSDAVVAKQLAKSGALPNGRVSFEIEKNAESERYTLTLKYAPENAAAIAGATFKVHFPQDRLEILSVKHGDFWQTKPLQIEKITDGVASVGQMLPGTQQLQEFGGALIEIHFSSQTTPEPSWFELSNLALVAPDGAVNEPGVATSVNDRLETHPEAFQLYAAYPNPFNPQTTIRFSLAAESRVNLSVFNLHGQRVRTLLNERRAPGDYYVLFDASGLPSGAYFYTLDVDGRSKETKRLVLLK